MIGEKIATPHPRLAEVTNKSVPFSYHGNRLQFKLSHALFSSFNVDDGTRFLLKTMATSLDCSPYKNLLDLGCGVGIIGLSLLKKYPHLVTDFSDRDALALAFTRANALLNELDGITTRGQLGLPDPDAAYDIIVSNIPAKIGAPAMEDLFARCLAALQPEGVFCLVVISSLAQEVAALVEKQQAKVLLHEKTPRHTVYHLRTGIQQEYAADPLAPYIRCQQQFTIHGTSYKASTAYNLPDFDTPGFRLLAAIRCLEQENPQGRLLFWNPGQGHLPLYLHHNKRGGIKQYTLASRDLLQLKISERNLRDSGISEENINLHHISFPEDSGQKFDYLLINPDIIPESDWCGGLWRNLPGLMHTGSRLMIMIQNSHQHRLLQAAALSGFSVLKKIKHKGYTAAILRQKSVARQNKA